MLDSYFGIGGDSDNDEDEDCSIKDDGYEGWFWTRAESLNAIWFEDGQKERHGEVYTWDEESRLVHLEARRADNIAQRSMLEQGNRLHSWEAALEGR
jgi:hypothetical protein